MAPRTQRDRDAAGNTGASGAASNGGAQRAASRAARTGANGAPAGARKRGRAARGKSADERAAKVSADRRNREHRILDAAVTLLIRWGYRKTTIDDVAREAGIGKGTIYLHWKDKGELFRAALWRTSQQATEDMMKRVAADPNGGQFDRLWAHGMVAVFANPLLAKVMTGKSDLFRGLIESFDPAMLNQLFGNSEEQILRMQRAGLIRRDLSVPVILFLMGALKTGIVSVSEIVSAELAPSTRELTEALSDLMRRWLQPESGPGDSEEGKRIMSEWLDNIIRIGTARK